MENKCYESPLLEEIAVAVEQGFNASVGVEGFTPGETDFWNPQPTTANYE